MTLPELTRELCSLPMGGDLTVDQDKFSSAQQLMIGMYFELGIPVFTTFDIRFMFAGRWVVWPQGDWDDHALSLKAAGWVQ